MLRGVCLFLGPSRLGGLLRNLASTPIGQCLQAPLAADSAAFAPHLGHHLRDQRAGRLLGLWRRFCRHYGFEEHAAGILDRVERLAFALRHTSRSHGSDRFVKRLGMNSKTTKLAFT
jgi:hypothetical protein